MAAAAAEFGVIVLAANKAVFAKASREGSFRVLTTITQKLYSTPGDAQRFNTPMRLTRYQHELYHNYIRAVCEEAGTCFTCSSPDGDKSQPPVAVIDDLVVTSCIEAGDHYEDINCALLQSDMLPRALQTVKTHCIELVAKEGDANVHESVQSYIINTRVECSPSR